MPFLSEFNSGGGAPGYRLRLITGKFIDDNPDPVAIRDFTVQNGNFMITTTDGKVYIGRSVNRLERVFAGTSNFGDFLLEGQKNNDVSIGGDPYGTQFTSAVGIGSGSTTSVSQFPYIREYVDNDNYYGQLVSLSMDSVPSANGLNVGAISKFIVSPDDRLFYLNVGPTTSTTRTIRIYEWDTTNYTFQNLRFTNNSPFNISLSGSQTANSGSTSNATLIRMNLDDFVTTIEQAGNSLVMYFTAQDNAASKTMYQLEISGPGNSEAEVTVATTQAEASLSLFSGTLDLAINTNPTARKALLTDRRVHNSDYLYFDGTNWNDQSTNIATQPFNLFRGAAYSSASDRFYTISSRNAAFGPGAIFWTTTPDDANSWQPDTSTDIKMCYYLRNDSGKAYASTGATSFVRSAGNEIVSAPTECLIQQLT